MDGKTFYTLIVTVAIAIVGLFGKYWNDLRIAERKDRLERVTSQLRDLYGPLRALCQASDAAWTQFRAGCRPGGSFFGSHPPPTDDDLASWRLWMKEVFIPLHVRMEQVILSTLHLVVGGEVPACIPTLLAHVAAYRPVLKKWDTNDLREHTSAINYPGKLLTAYVDAAYAELAREQQVLIRASRFERAAANKVLQRTAASGRR